MNAMGRRAKVIRLPTRSPVVPAAPALVELRRCRDQAEALVVSGLLKSQGIWVVVRSNLAQSVHPFSVGDQGEVVLLVAADDAPRARAALARRGP